MIKLPFSDSLYFKNRNYYTQSEDCNEENLHTSSFLNSSPSYGKNSTVSDSTKETRSSQNFSLDIFGLHLQLDDLIIIGVLYFLYKEKVDDNMLYLLLFLLLFN